METAEIGVVGGSGLRALAGHSEQADLTEVVIETPWGPPSGPYRIGTVAGRRVAFLARHGEGHRLLPSEVNFRANVWGFRLLGVRRLLSASAVGSLREAMAPRHFVIADQFIDLTHARARTFFGAGLVAHVGLAEPTCPELGPLAAGAARDAGAVVHDRGTYVCIEGPQFSTKAESGLYRSWSADVIGMTNATEARLAREAGLCYCCLAMVTDYDCWREDEESVSVDGLLAVLNENAERANRTIGRLIETLPADPDCACQGALVGAVITDPRAVTPATRERLTPILPRRPPE